MQIFTFISEILVLTGMLVLGFQLLYDPWMHERFYRAIRENCRIENRFLDWTVDEMAAEIRNYISITMLFTAIGNFMK
jgi:hypothetical protein